MANPQRELGTTDIAHEILEALMRTRIPGEARQIIDTIFRQTYGWHKKEDRIALSQFCGFTSMKKPNVIRAIKKAHSMNIIIIKKDNDYNSIYLINKDFTTWVPLSKKITTPKSLSKKIIGVIEKDNASLSKKIPTKQTTTKQTITKQSVEENFETFWGKYPVKKEKKKSFELFKKVSPEVYPEIFKAIEDQKAEKDLLRLAGKFCPEWKHPTTWLRGECWTDVVEVAKSSEPKKKYTTHEERLKAFNSTTS